MTSEPAENIPDRTRLEYLEQLLIRIDTLGMWAVGMVRDGFAAYLHGDSPGGKEVVERDDRLTALDVQIEQEAMRDLATHQPAARDLRTVASALKVASYLDRVGRQGYEIAWLAVERTHEVPEALPSSDPVVEMLGRMAGRATIMVEQSVIAFRHQDPVAARAVVEQDDVVDALNREILARLTRSDAEPRDVSVGLKVRHALVGRSLERVADNACKIAEKTVYSATGLRRTETEFLPNRKVPDGDLGKQ